MASERIQRRLDRLLDQIEEAADRLDWPEVRELSKAVLAYEPEHQDALSFMAAADRAQGGSTANSIPPPQQSETVFTESISKEPLSSQPPTPDAERRQLTVMFCDLQGSTVLSQQLDPEELRDVIRSYQELCAGAVSRFEGHIAKYLGDGVLIYFGYPQAHEDDPQRAVRSGLAILEDLVTLNTRLKADKGLELTVRIGVHTGLVVAGEMGGGETIEELAIVGDTPNIAARLQEAAEPNSVVISGVTANLIQGFFVCKALGAQDLKGIAESMELFGVVSESGAQTRFDVATAAQLTQLIGREQELGLLLDRWEQASEGLGQIVMLSGEAGIGKSRLIEALAERVAEDRHTHRRLRCSDYHQNSALHPFTEYLETWLNFGPGDSPEDKLSRLEEQLASMGLPLSEAVPLMSGVLSLRLNERFPMPTISPEVQRTRTLELLVTLLLDSAEDQPTFIIVEDLHWADPSTLAVLTLLLDQAPTAKVLALLSFRPEFSPPWVNRAYVTPVSLSRLTRRLATNMVDRLTRGKSLPEEIISQVASKSDGVPLFVEELTRMVVESDLVAEADDHYELTGPLPPLAIPSTLQDSLTARLDRLSEAREVLQLGSVLGREFTYELMQTVSPMDEETLQSHLQHLIDTEFLYQRGPALETNYTFKHALIQDAAYESLLRSIRQRYHQHVAQVLKERFADAVENQPELLAHHYSEAGLTDHAVPYWQHAGELALAKFAHDEAGIHFQRALDARENAPTDAQTAQLLFGLGRSQLATLPRHETHTAVTSLRRAFDYYANAGDIAQAVTIAGTPINPVVGTSTGAAQLVFNALEMISPDSHQAGRLYSLYGRVIGTEEASYTEAQKALSRALEIARREGDEALEMETLLSTALVDCFHLHWRSAIQNAMTGIEKASQTDDPYSEVLLRFYTMCGQFAVGDLGGAREQARAMLGPAEKVPMPFLLATALWSNEMVARLSGDWQSSRSFSDRGLAVAPQDARLLITRVMSEYEVGDLEQASDYLERLLEVMQVTSPVGGGTMESGFVASATFLGARITEEHSKNRVGETAAAGILSSTMATPFIAVMARGALGLLAVQRRDAQAAREQHEALWPARGTILSWSLAVDRLLGLLAQTMGELDQAIGHFEDALNFCRDAGYRPELAWTRCDYADLLSERNNEGDRAKAMTMLDESLAISSELGMKPLTERAQSRRDKLPG